MKWLSFDSLKAFVTATRMSRKKKNENEAPDDTREQDKQEIEMKICQETRRTATNGQRTEEKE